MSRRVIAATACATLALWLGGALPASAGDGRLYVSLTGSDANPGTSPKRPLATIQKALEAAPAGSTVVLAPGRYLQDVVTVRDGVTITGPRTAVISGTGTTTRIISVRHDRTTLSGFTVDGLVGPSDQLAAYRDKLIYAMSTTPGDGVSGLRITGMRLANAAGECLRLRYLITGAEVDHNEIGPCGVEDFRFAGGGKNGEGVYLGTAPEQQGLNGAPDARPDVSRDNRIHHNRIDTQGNECVDIKENSTANLVDHNFCTGQLDDKSAGLDSRGSGNTFRSNAVVDNVGAGIRFGGDTPTDGVNNVATGNLIARNAAGGIKFQATPQGAVCGNRMFDNPPGNAVGTYADQFQPTAPCSRD